MKESETVLPESKLITNWMSSAKEIHGPYDRAYFISQEGISRKFYTFGLQARDKTLYEIVETIFTITLIQWVDSNIVYIRRMPEINIDQAGRIVARTRLHVVNRDRDIIFPPFKKDEGESMLQLSRDDMVYCKLAASNSPECRYLVSESSFREKHGNVDADRVPDKDKIVMPCGQWAVSEEYSEDWATISWKVKTGDDNGLFKAT